MAIPEVNKRKIIVKLLLLNTDGSEKDVLEKEEKQPATSTF